MSLSAHPSHGQGQAGRDVTIAWVAVAAMVAMLVAIPVIGSTGLETSFRAGALLLGAFTAVLVAIGVVAWRFGFRARHEGRGSGVLAAAVGAAIGGAYYLRLRGYFVTIFEALDRLGGMLRVGIPDYRLPTELLEREIAYLLSTGIEVQSGRRLGRDFSLESLKAAGFDAVMLAIGAHVGMQAGIPGEQDFESVMNAVDWLREVNLGARVCPGRRVVVIGGGNVAVDAARVARRLGSESVAIVYRRTRQEMPAYAEEIEDTLAEGIGIYYLTAPLLVVGCGCRVQRGRNRSGGGVSGSR